MTATATEVLISEPGLYPTVTAEQYHADPVQGGSLTSTGARALLPPSCPALYRWRADHPPETRKTWDFGHAAHRLVLGVGAGLAVIDAGDWRTKAAKTERDEARAAGRTPILTADHETVLAMAAALRQHPTAAALLDPATGDAEQTIVWEDQATGVMCRAMIDWLRIRTPVGRALVIPDYKTCVSAEPEALSRAFQNLGYHQQAEHYSDAVASITGRQPQFLFICQEKTAPYLVTVVELDPVARRIGQARNHWARTVYQRCTETDTWPGYVDGIHMLSLPRWAEIQEGE